MKMPEYDNKTLIDDIKIEMKYFASMKISELYKPLRQVIYEIMMVEEMDNWDLLIMDSLITNPDGYYCTGYGYDCKSQSREELLARVAVLSDRVLDSVSYTKLSQNDNIKLIISPTGAFIIAYNSDIVDISLITIPNANVMVTGNDMISYVDLYVNIINKNNPNLDHINKKLATIRSNISNDVINLIKEYLHSKYKIIKIPYNTL